MHHLREVATFPHNSSDKRDILLNQKEKMLYPLGVLSIVFVVVFDGGGLLL